MADFPTIDFSQYQWSINDQNYLGKWNNMQTALNTLQGNIDQFGTRMNELASSAADSKVNAANSEQEARRFRDETEVISQGQLPKGEAGDTLIQGDDGIYRPGKIKSTVAVECSVSGADLAASGQSYQINLSGRSRHVEGSLASFRIEWWDGSEENIDAQNGSASISKIVDVEDGLTISINVTALDDVGNESRPAILTADVADLTIAPATVSSPENGTGYIFDAQPWPLKVTTSDFVAYSPDTHSETQMQVRDASTLAILSDDTFSAQEDLTNLSSSTSDYARSTQAIDVRVRHAGESFGWGPWGAWSRVTLDGQVGEIVISSGGSQTIKLPPGITDTVSAVCVGRGFHGGGALCWSNKVPVGDDRLLAIVVGDSASIGQHMAASRGTAQNVSPGAGYTGGEGGGLGGEAAIGTYAGKGGAGGYRGNGGNGPNGGNGGDGKGGAGGGSAYSTSNNVRQAGGVGLYGEGESGKGGGNWSQNVTGQPGSISPRDPAEGYGYGSNSGVRGSSAVRILWGGGRSFPNNAAYIDVSTYQGGS